MFCRIFTNSAADGGVMKSMPRVLFHQMPLTTARTSRMTTGMGTRTAGRWRGLFARESGNHGVPGNSCDNSFRDISKLFLDSLCQIKPDPHWLIELLLIDRPLR